MTKTRTRSFLVLLLLSGGLTTTTTTRTFVGAFLPLSIISKRSIVDSQRTSSSCVLGALRNDDFSSIFGQQEAAERRTRDLAREYHPQPTGKQPTTTTTTTKKPIINADDGKDESTSENTKQRQESSRVVEDPAAMAIKNTTKVVRKYVPPSSSF